MEVRRVLQLLFRHIEYCDIRITLTRLSSGRIGLDGLDGRRGGRVAGEGGRGIDSNLSTFSPPMQRLERNSHCLLADAKEAADADDDGLSVAVMVHKHVLDSAYTLLLSAHNADATELRRPPLVNRLIRHE